MVDVADADDAVSHTIVSHSFANTMNPAVTYSIARIFEVNSYAIFCCCCFFVFFGMHVCVVVAGLIYKYYVCFSEFP